MTNFSESPLLRSEETLPEDRLSRFVDTPSTAVARAANGRPLSVGERHRLAGELLDACLERVGRLAPPVTVELGIRLARSVGELHAAGRVHHALKPSSIFVARCDDEAFVRVLRPVSSFGLATPAYLAPEQVDGGRTDPRTDVYAIGVILHQCLSGRLPYEAAGMVELAAQIASGQPLGLPEEIDPALREIVARAMAYDANARFATVAALGGALETWAAEFRRVEGLLADFLDTIPVEPCLPTPPAPAPPTPAPARRDSHHAPPLAFAFPREGLPTLAAPIRVDPDDYERGDIRLNSPSILPVFVVRDND